MIALDTCVLARWILGDDPVQQDVAAKLLATEACTVSWSVLVELCWVLERSAQLPREQVVLALETLLDLENMTVANDASLAWVIERYALGADFPDMAHLASHVVGSSEFATFDRLLARQAGPDTPLPVRKLSG